MKKTLTVLLAVLMAVFSVTTYAITLETVEAAAETAQTAEAAEAALAATTVTPGINAFTGTKLPATMDTTPLNVKGKSGTLTITVPYDDEGNNVARWSCTLGAENYPQWQFNVPLKEGTKYYFASKVKFSGTNTSFGHWLMYDNGASIAAGLSNTTGTWENITKDFTSTKTQTFFAIQQKVVGASSENPAYFYYDDMTLVPYYKITYYGLDGETTVTTVDYLFDENGDIADIYLPDLSLVEGATAYSLTPDGAPVNYVELNNADIELYARNDVSTPADVVCFTDFKEVYSTTVTGNKFIMPYNTTTDFDLAEGKYLNFWTDGTNYYYPGDVVDAEAVKATVLVAVIDSIPVWNETKGYKLFEIDFEQGGTYSQPVSYKNPKYASGSFSSRSDFTSTRSIVTDTDGNKVLKDVNQANVSHHLGGYTLNSAAATEDFKGAKSTYEYNVKYMDEDFASYYKSGSFIRMCYTTTDGQHVNSGDIYAQTVKDKKYNEWQHMKTTVVTPKGFIGGYYQYSMNKAPGVTTIYTDDIEAWSLPDTVAFFKSSRTAEDWVRFPVDKTVETFTMPSLADAGFEVENFLAWTDGKNLYEVGKAYALTAIEHKILYPFTQDATTPAVISLFEGNVDKDVAKTKLTEPVIDDGRTALMVAYWGDTWNGKSYDGDPRMMLTYPARFDASKYTVIAAMTKVDHSYSAVVNTVQNGEIKANTTGSFQIFNYINSSYSYNANSSVTSWSNDADGKYHYKEIDMATQSANATYPWIDTGWGFTFDVVRATYGGRAFIDYVRVYKDGLNTVTYDTNAPAGVAKEDIGNVDAETGNVAPDTGRGLGTGYLLKDDRPVVPGYKFAGWALTPDAGVEDVIESFDFTEDTTVYAVWVPDNGAINARKTAEMKFSDTETGSIRFKADVTADQVQDAVEYGFIVARKSHLDTYSEELTHSFIYRTQKTFTPLYVEGVAYQYDREADEVLVNKIYEKIESTGDVVYTALCTNIPLTDTGINDKLVARPYYKYNLNGRVVYVYGTAHEASLGEVANAIDRNSSNYLDNKDYVDGILAKYVPAAE